jgi:hypothetical protein
LLLEITAPSSKTTLSAKEHQLNIKCADPTVSSVSTSTAQPNTAPSTASDDRSNSVDDEEEKKRRRRAERFSSERPVSTSNNTSTTMNPNTRRPNVSQPQNRTSGGGGGGGIGNMGGNLSRHPQPQLLQHYRDGILPSYRIPGHDLPPGFPSIIPFGMPQNTSLPLMPTPPFLPMPWLPFAAAAAAAAAAAGGGGGGQGGQGRGQGRPFMQSHSSMPSRVQAPVLQRPLQLPQPPAYSRHEREEGEIDDRSSFSSRGGGGSNNNNNKRPRDSYESSADSTRSKRSRYDLDTPLPPSSTSSSSSMHNTASVSVFVSLSLSLCRRADCWNYHSCVTLADQGEQQAV